MNVVVKKLTAFLRFCRLHTIYSTLLAPTCIALNLVLSGRVAWGEGEVLVRWAQITLASFLCNVYIVGLNQLYDVEIDRINKPYLPLVSGLLTTREAWVIVLSSLGGGLAMVLSLCSSWAVIAMYSTALCFGTFYSTPVGRWKNHYLTAAFPIIICRGALLPLVCYLHIGAGESSPGVPLFTNSIIAVVVFGTLWAGVIAVYKDIPDVVGDQKNGVLSLSVRFGVKNVFKACLAVQVLALAAVSTVYCCLLESRLEKTAALLSLASVSIATLLYRARSVDFESAKSLFAEYMFGWNIFYAMYLCSVWL